MADQKPAAPKAAKKNKGIYVILSPEHRAQLEQLAKEDFRPDVGSMLSVLIARNFARLTGE